MGPIDAFTKSSPLVKGVVMCSIITVVALATLTASYIWWNTGALLPFASLGVYGTIGLGTLMGIAAIGTIVFFGIVAICVGSCVKKRNQQNPLLALVNQQATAELNKKNLLYDRQKAIFTELRCTGFQEIKEKDREASGDFRICPTHLFSDMPKTPSEITILNQVRHTKEVGSRFFTFRAHDDEVAPLSRGNYIVRPGSDFLSAYFIYQNSLGIFFFCYDGTRQEYKRIEEGAHQLAQL